MALFPMSDFSLGQSNKIKSPNWWRLNWMSMSIFRLFSKYSTLETWKMWRSKNILVYF